MLALSFLLTFVGYSAERPPLKHVLFLNSYHEGYEWSDEVLRGIRSAVVGQAFQVEIWTENMDRKRVSGDGPTLAFRTFLASKYHGRKLDAVVASDDDAIQFMKQHGTDAFGAAPVVFCGLNDWPLADQLPRAQFTGVLEDFQVSAILDLALKFNPGAGAVWVVSDNSPLGNHQKSGFEQIAAQRPRLRFQFVDGAELTLNEIVSRMGKVDKNDIVILTAFTRDRTEEYLERAEAQRRIAQASAGPVYSPSISALGQGIVGANDNAGFAHGLIAGRKLVQLLNGTPPDRIPIEKHARERYVFDYAQLVRFGFEDRVLPAGSRILNRPGSFYSDNRRAIWLAASAVAVEAVIILFLLVNIRRRRAAELALAGQAGALAAANEGLHSANAALQAEIEEREKAEGRVQAIQEQFWQSQKMEAVGRLAGGIAHDFNNLLTVISGYGRMILDGTQPESTPEWVEQMVKAGDRAAALTSQLLAFSRKNLIQPRAISLNEVVRDTLSMMQRILGEDVALSTSLQPGLPAVMADAGQVSQVLLNLAANARDAMAAGGRFEIGTSAVVLGAGYAREHAEIEPGRYVELSVSDTGIGMNEETRRRIFEPFFTTKPVGHGTGLGLATVYGMIKQAGGSIWVYSEPAEGTTFKIYLPALETGAEPLPRPQAQVAAPSGSEAILVVEDQDEVRSFMVTVLEAHGYRVLPASSGEEALRLASQPPGRIDLLLTDVVMPGMNGRALAEKLGEQLPGLKVLYTSGYTEAVIVSRGVLEPNLAYLAKPFAPDDLLRMVRQALD
ncbi:ATP-binding protein [Paludibaculum fermentans]|uniref:histidine kinase n=1 Tax=Paludibaculum fermentans TaxID=1473598 RepID=A0A7S7SHX5_PALFE|nr:ATP-binding protein [Paludibaculum fermentans]QOY86392.1 response regulator [Paludibaculum fermentans]